MANLKIVLKGDDVIDNASIYLEDPQESIEYKLDPDSDIDWRRDVTVPVEGELEYSLHVVAFSGTHFTCSITDTVSEKKIEFDGTTGTRLKNRANIKGAQNFE